MHLTRECCSVLCRATARYCRRCSHQPHTVLLSDTGQGVSQPPLVLAVLSGDMELVQMLIADDADADLDTPAM